MEIMKQVLYFLLVRRAGSPHLQRIFHSRRGLEIALVVCALCIAAVNPAPAQAFTTDDSREFATTDNRLVTPIGNAELLPPLPFEEPQIGPIIKRGFPEEVERWTTAFIPRNGDLDNLSPIEFPTEDERWIRVDLSEQTVVAYEGDKPLRGFIISSGLPGTPTVTGEFRIRVKVPSQNMTGGNRASGNYYNLDNVQWVQYFYEDYSFHGTYWHNDFGTPKSHGCLNMTISDAKWLFDWASPTWDGTTLWYGPTPDDPGTLVVVHE
jgi:lipoprotein-anchoring transpeptidase ErfK/SrfK